MTKCFCTNMTCYSAPRVQNKLFYTQDISTLLYSDFMFGTYNYIHIEPQRKNWHKKHKLRVINSVKIIKIMYFTSYFCTSRKKCLCRVYILLRSSLTSEIWKNSCDVKIMYHFKETGGCRITILHTGGQKACRQIYLSLLRPLHC
jgi:hypothetical protein